MKKTRLQSIAMILACCAAGTACVSVPYQPVYREPAAAAVVPSGAEGQPFYDDLTPYGQWVYVSGPGWVWSPYNEPASWRPYQFGHWVLTDYGWTWASDENFGWAVYHYGRWHLDSAYGWVWVPGTEWGPAWVAWHEGGGWVGWAPLPWQVRWRAGVGLDWGGLSVNVALGPSSWYFVQTRDMVDPGLRNRIAPPSRNVTLIQITRNVTNYTYVDNRIVNQSVKVETIGRAVGHTIPRYRVRDADSPEVAHGGRQRGEDFVVFRPNPVRGARSQGRLVPPGHDEMHHPGNYRPDATQIETTPQETPPDAAASKPESGQQTGRTEPRQPRFFKALEEQRRRAQAPHGPPAEANPTQSTAPERGAGPATPSATRSDGPAPGDQHEGAALPAKPGPANARPGRPEQAKPQPVTPGQANARPAKPGQSKMQPAKSKAKKPGDAASKPAKPKPEASGSEESDADQSKP